MMTLEYCTRMKLCGRVDTQLVIQINSDRQYGKQGNVKGKVVSVLT
jgi:hypothetical protein